MITTMKEEAIKILRKYKKPMTSHQIIEKIIERENYRLRGKTPKASLYSMIIRDIQKNKEKSIFIRVEDGFFIFNKNFKKLNYN